VGEGQTLLRDTEDGREQSIGNDAVVHAVIRGLRDL
jgi:hypothetical protein